MCWISRLSRTAAHLREERVNYARTISWLCKSAKKRALGALEKGMLSSASVAHIDLRKRRRLSPISVTSKRDFKIGEWSGYSTVVDNSSPLIDIHCPESLGSA